MHRPPAKGGVVSGVNNWIFSLSFRNERVYPLKISRRRRTLQWRIRNLRGWTVTCLVLQNRYPNPNPNVCGWVGCSWECPSSRTGSLADRLA